MGSKVKGMDKSGNMRLLIDLLVIFRVPNIFKRVSFKRSGIPFSCG
jgi:hypothetical protein